MRTHTCAHIHTIHTPPPLHTHTHTHTTSLHVRVTGVLSDVLNYILLHAEDTVDVGDGVFMGEGSGEAVKSKGLETGFSHSNEAVFVACFRFLKALAKDNIQVQRRCVVMFLMPIFNYCDWESTVSGLE